MVTCTFVLLFHLYPLKISVLRDDDVLPTFKNQCRGHRVKCSCPCA